MGGSGSKSSHEALLKTLGINDALLQGVEKAVFSSFQIKGILKLNGLLKEEDRTKRLNLLIERKRVQFNMGHIHLSIDKNKLIVRGN